MKRVLILSNNCFSDTNSNGRTLGKLFKFYEKDKIAQFYISGEPDYKYCNNFFQVTDSNVVNSIIKIKKKKSQNTHQDLKSMPERNVKNMLIRNILWNLGLWMKNGFLGWADKFNPEIVLIQAGDCAFMNNLAVKVSKRYNIPIVIYNTETYYFKTKNYFRDGHDFLYTIFLGNFRTSYKRMLKRTKLSIYLCDAIEECYRIGINAPGEIIYNSSDICTGSMDSKNFPNISYIGNLGLGRDKSLIEIGKALQEINSNLYVDIYGKAEPSTEKELANAPGIKFHGFISYNQVQNVIENSHILIHVESFDPFYVVDSEYGFSTKIADSLLSNRVLFVYSPDNVACVKYLKQNGIGVVVSDYDMLTELLSKLVSSFDLCRAISAKQLAIGKKNHLTDNNSLKFCKLLNEL